LCKFCFAWKLPAGLVGRGVDQPDGWWMVAYNDDVAAVAELFNVAGDWLDAVASQLPDEYYK
jgi:hypothetical protein